MNKEQKKFKKIIKVRKKRKIKKDLLNIERNKKRSKINYAKKEYKEAKKESSKEVLALRQKAIKQFKKFLNIPDSKILSLEKLKKLYENLIRKSTK